MKKINQYILVQLSNNHHYIGHISEYGRSQIKIATIKPTIEIRSIYLNQTLKGFFYLSYKELKKLNILYHADTIDMIHDFLIKQRPDILMELTTCAE